MYNIIYIYTSSSQNAAAADEESQIFFPGALPLAASFAHTWRGHGLEAAAGES